MPQRRIRDVKIKPKATTPDDWLNPKGAIARDMRTSALRAGYLSIVCAHWLNHHQQETWRAGIDEPTWDLPARFPDAKRFNQARKRCEAWDTKDRATAVAKRWDWPTVFAYWLSGGLERDVDALLRMMPSESRDRVRRELDEF